MSTEIAPNGQGAEIVQLPGRVRRLDLPRNVAAATLTTIPPGQTSSFQSLRKTIFLSFSTVFLLIGATGALVAKTVIAGAVIANGILVVETGPKKVQHQSGGIVKDVKVEDGDAVKAGQVLIELDRTTAEAQLRAAENSLIQRSARLARLVSERDDLPVMNDGPPVMTTMLTQNEQSQVFNSERQQFVLRKEDRDGQRSQLRERVAQTREEVAGNTAQLEASMQESAVVADELKGLHSLFARKLTPYQRVSEMERTASQLRATQGALRAAIASANGKIAELQLAIIQVDQNFRSSITDQIGEAQTAIGELSQQSIVMRENLRHTEIRAPQDGVVHELAVRGPGAVVQSAETLMLIVPRSDRLVGEVKLRPSDIDQVYASQPARIQFSAFDRGTTPAVNGEVREVSPDLIEDKRNGGMYYTARIGVGQTELQKLSGLDLVPGMPIEVFIQTGDRTILSYLTKPLTDQVNRAFR